MKACTQKQPGADEAGGRAGSEAAKAVDSEAGIETAGESLTALSPFVVLGCRRCLCIGRHSKCTCRSSTIPS